MILLVILPFYPIYFSIALKYIYQKYFRKFESDVE